MVQVLTHTAGQKGAMPWSQSPSSGPALRKPQAGGDPWRGVKVQGLGWDGQQGPHLGGEGKVHGGRAVGLGSAGGVRVSWGRRGTREQQPPEQR